MVKNTKNKVQDILKSVHKITKKSTQAPLTAPVHQLESFRDHSHLNPKSGYKAYSKHSRKSSSRNHRHKKESFEGLSQVESREDYENKMYQNRIGVLQREISF